MLQQDWSVSHEKQLIFFLFHSLKGISFDFTGCLPTAGLQDNRGLMRWEAQVQLPSCRTTSKTPTHPNPALPQLHTLPDHINSQYVSKQHQVSSMQEVVAEKQTSNREKYIPFTFLTAGTSPSPWPSSHEEAKMAQCKRRKAERSNDQEKWTLDVYVSVAEH